MKNPTVFHLLSSELGQERIPCVLVGGFAVNHYRVTRHTADVDLLITQEDFSKVLPLLKKAGYSATFKQDVFARLQNKDSRFMDVDFLFVDKNTLSAILKAGKEIAIAGKQFVVPSLEHLLALKFHAMKSNPKEREYRDLPDVVGLIQRNSVDFRAEKFRDLCLRYGSEKLYQKIHSLLENA